MSVYFAIYFIHIIIFFQNAEKENCERNSTESKNISKFTGKKYKLHKKWEK